MKTKYKILIAAYVLAAIATFGASYKQQPRFIDDDPTPRIIGAGMCSAFWPLYWSQQLWK